MSAEDRLFAAARTGDASALAALLDDQPEKLEVRDEPYEWSLLHHAAAGGHAAAVDLLLARGFDPNARERGDNSYAMHWAAAAGHLDVVRRLADAGGDVIGKGDDHALEVIGWATCWEPCHAAVAEFLLSRGATHHIFSAIAMNLADEVRRIVLSDPRALSTRLTRNEDHQLPLHFAVGKGRSEMVTLLVDLGADPLAVDGAGHAPAAYAVAPDTDRRAMEAISEMTAAELLSADRGRRRPRVGGIDLLAALALGDEETSARFLGDIPNGVLHQMAKRGDAVAVQWLLEHGANPNARWSHWNDEVTPMHLAAAHGHVQTVQLLLRAGADPRIRDSEHEADVADWAEHFGQPAVTRMLTS
jgi:ankyrin repeat protein